eukprot:1613697-Amphidinium_carterae.1
MRHVSHWMAFVWKVQPVRSRTTRHQTKTSLCTLQSGQLNSSIVSTGAAGLFFLGGGVLFL